MPKRDGAMVFSPATACAAAAAIALVAFTLPTAAALRFDDVAAQEGLAFARAGDRYDMNPNFVELMGGGSCWLDFDRDGELDVFIVNGWYNDTRILTVEQPASPLFRNLGRGAGFADATQAAGLDVTGWTQACSAADYDGDGWTDLFVAGYDIQRLFRNDGQGGFVETTAASGISAAGKCPDTPCWGSGSAWADYDRDGCLDLYVINFVEYDMAAGGPRGPGGRDGQPSQLYRNDCDGTFTDVTAQAGANGAPGPEHSKNWGVSWLDYDRDGWLDIYVASDGTPNILYRNDHDGTFTDVAEQAGVADVRNGMGLTINDCDEDGYEDLFFTHYRSVEGQNEEFGYDGFYVNNGDGTFADHSGEGDLQRAHDYIRWGTGFEDFDNDGDVDLHVASGNTEPLGIDTLPAKPLLLLGDGDCHWTDITNTTGPAMQLNRMARGTAYADYDHDGIMDILQVNLVNQPSFLLRGSDAAGHWLTVELRQPGKNPQAIMATVNLALPDGRVLHRTMNPYQSIHGNNAPQVHFGLGDFTTANVTVGWPDLVETTFTDLQADRIVRLFRDGRVQTDTLAPRTQVLLDGGAPSQVWFRQPVTLGLIATDSAAGLPAASGVANIFLLLDGTEIVDPDPFVLASGLHRLRVHSTDAAGNVEPPRWLSVGVDGTAPSLGMGLDGTLVDGWYRGPVRVALPCADATSGVEAVAWSLDGGAWTPYEGPFDLTRPGPHTLTARCADAAGNVAEQSAQLAIDLGHPETVATIAGLAGTGGWWRSDLVVSLDAAAGLQSITALHYAIDAGASQEYDGPFDVRGEGAHAITFHAEDDAGRVEPEKTLEVRIDATPPAIEVKAVTRHVERPDMLVVGFIHAVEFGATDGGSGVGLAEAHREGEDFRVQPARPMKFLGEGRHTLSVRATDAAGNVAVLERVVYLDLTPPVVQVARPLDRSVNVGDQAVVVALWPFGTRALVAGPAPMEAAPVDDVAGVRRVFFLVNGATVATVEQEPWVWNWSLLPSPGVPSPSVRYVAEDGVGNRGAADFVVTAVGNPLAVLPSVPLGVAEPPFEPGAEESMAASAQAMWWAPLLAAVGLHRTRGRR